MDGGAPGAGSLGEVHAAAAGLAADVQGGTGAPAETLQSLRCERSRLLPSLGPPRPRPVPGPTARESFCRVALSVAFGKAWTIWWMGFRACHLPCVSSKLSVVPRSPLSFVPCVLIPISFRLVTCIFSFPIQMWPFCVSFPGGQA